MKKTMCMVMGLMMMTLAGSAAYAQEAEVGMLEPEIIDGLLDFSDVVSLPAIGIEEIPGLDAALDSFDEVCPLDFELGFTLASAYIWRGQNLGSDASFQPYVTVSPSFEPLGDLSFTYWADITKNEADRNEREFDYAVDYNFDILEALGKFGYSSDSAPYALTKVLDFNFDTGYIYYDFPPNGGSKSQEVYFGVAYNLPLHPSFTIYNDWDRGRGLWMEWGVSQDINLGLVTLATYATMGYNKSQWGESSALSTLDMGGSIPIAIGTHMTIEPFLSYTKRLNATYTGESDLTHDELYGGMNWSICF